MSGGIPVVPFEEKDSGWAGVMWQYLIEKCEVLCIGFNSSRGSDVRLGLLPLWLGYQ